MIFKNRAGQGIYLYATDASGNPKGLDAANITATISKDGGNAVATATVHPTEPTGQVGGYFLPLSQAETNCLSASVVATSTTTGVQLDPVPIYTEGGAIPLVPFDTAGGLPTTNTAASHADVQAITTNTARGKAIVPSWLSRPTSGSTTYELDLNIYTIQGQMDVPDAAPAVHARDATGVSLDTHLSATTMTLIATGRYKVSYTVQSTDAAAEVLVDFTWAVGGVNFALTTATQVQDAESLSTLLAIKSQTDKFAFDGSNNVKSAPQTPVTLTAGEHTNIVNDVTTAMTNLYGGLVASGTVNDVSPSASSFVISLDAPQVLPTNPNFVGDDFCFTSGNLLIGKQVVTGYTWLTSTTARVTFTVPFAAAPVNGDHFKIV